MPGKWIRGLAFGASVLIAGCGGDQPFEPGTGSIAGGVTDASSRGPLAGVDVSAGGKTVQTDAVGHYELTGVPAGEQLLTSSRLGYQERNDAITVVAGETRVIDLQLEPMPGPPGLTAAPGGEPGQIHLTWQHADDVQSYTLYWSTTAGVTAASGTRIPDLAGTSYDHSGLNPGALYHYVLAAVRGGLEGPASPEVSATAATVIGLSGMSALSTGPCCESVADTSIVASVTVSSLYQLVSVTARVEDRVTPLVVKSNNRWEGVISLSGLASHRTRTVTFTATDIMGTVATATQSFEHNRRAVVTMESPVHGSVVQGPVRIRVSCQDDVPTGCSRLRVIATAQGPGPIVEDILVDGPEDVDQDFSLARYDGREVLIWTQGIDDLERQTLSASAIVYVDVSPRLTKVAEVTGKGWLEDASSDRLLVLDTIANHDRDGTVRIQDRATGQSTDVLTGRDLFVTGARLTSRGAIFRATDHAYEWRDNTLLDLGTSSIPVLDAPYFAWTTSDAVLHRRNLETGSTIVVPDVDDFDFDVGSNGDVVYRLGVGEIKRFRAGVTTTIFDPDPDPALGHREPRTDGANVVFAKGAFFVEGSPFALLAVTASGVDTLVPSQPWPLFSPRADSDYQTNGGWVAYAKPVSLDVVQAWVRSPAGAHTQIGFFSGVSALEELSSDGQVAFRSPARAAARRYLWAPGGSASEVSSGLGRPVFIGGQLHVMIGNALFRVN